MTLLVEVLIVLGLVGSSASIIVYSRVPWWRTMIGRAVMIYLSGVALLFMIFFAAVVMNWTGTLAYLIISRIVLGLLVIAIYWKLVALIRAQNWTKMRDVPGGARRGG